MAANNSNKGSHYVVDGAMYTCSFDSTGGTVISQIKSNEKKVIVQNKPLVTDQDTTFSNPFGTCFAQPNPSGGFMPCCYSLNWLNDGSIDSNKNVALPTEKSKLQCQFGGIVSCLFHGQQQSVVWNDIQNASPQVLDIANSFFIDVKDCKKYQEELKTFGVSTIKVFVKNTVGKEIELKDNSPIRVGTNVILKAYDNKNKRITNKMVSWAMFQLAENQGVTKTTQKVNNLRVYRNVTDDLTMAINREGVFKIEGMGNGKLRNRQENYAALLNYEDIVEYNKTFNDGDDYVLPNEMATPPFDPSCCKELNVLANNRIVGIKRGKTEVSDSQTVYVKQGETSVFVPEFILDFRDDLEEVKCTIKKKNGETVLEKDYSFDSKTRSFSFMPSAAEVDYLITFSLHKKIVISSSKKAYEYFEDRLICEKSVSVHSYDEAMIYAYEPGKLNSEKHGGNITLRRPDEGLEFEVKFQKGNYKNDILHQTELKKIKWSVKKNKKQVGIESTNDIYLDIFKEEGFYEITADLSASKFSNGGKSLVSHTLQVSRNTVTAINVSSTNGRRYVGVKYPINLSYLYGDGTYQDEKNAVELTCDGVDEDCLKRGMICVKKPGKYTLVAKLGGKECKLENITIKEAQIKKWEFCDCDKKKISYIGKKNKFGIIASVPAWASTNGEDQNIKVSIYCQKKELCSFNTKIDKSGNFHVDNIDVEKDILGNTTNKNVTYNGYNDLILTFVVFDSPSGIVKNLSITERMGLFSTRTNLCVKSIPFVDGYFAEANGKRLVKMLTYNDKANARLQVLNYSDAKLKNLKFRLYENKRGLDPVVFENKEYIKPNESGIVEIPMPIGEDGFKEENHGDSKLPRLFYFKVFEKCKSHSTLMLDFHSTETLRRVCSYPKTFAEYDYDVRKETSAVQDEVLNELSAETAGKKYESEKLKEVRSYYHQMKIASPKDELKKYESSYNSLAPVVVGEEWEKEEKEERHEKANTKCFCHRDFTVEEVKKIITELRSAFGSPAFKNDEIWEESPYVNNKSIASFTYELNIAIKRYGINRCIQKIVFLAMACVETAYFRASEEAPNNYASSKSKFKGRGLLHMTHEGHYKTYNGRLLKNVLESPNLISDDIHNIVDSGATFFTNRSFMHNRVVSNNSKVVNKYQECFSVPYMLTLSQLCLFMESVPTKEIDYYLLINRLLNNPSKETPLSWEARQKAFVTLKKVFNYNKDVCKEVEKDFPMHNTEWHDPLDVMQICAYQQRGGFGPYNASFHYRGSRPHQGVDLFAKLNTPIYACLDGRIVSASAVGDYGNVIVLAIYEESQVQIFKNRRKKDFEPYFPDEYTDGPGFNKDSDFFYLAYAHLSSFCVIEGDEVKAGDIIGYSGETGNAKGTKGPHVHFEVRSAQSCGKGMNNRCNPSLYFDYEQYTPIAYDQNKKVRIESHSLLKDYDYKVSKVEIKHIDGSVSTIDKKDFEVDSNDQYCYKRDKNE